MQMKTKLINEMLRHSSTRILLDHQKRFRNCFKIIYNFRKDIATSHTPPSNRKSSIRIILERIYLNSRYGYLGYIFYFSLKMDRKGDKRSSHITEGEFIRLRDFVNFNYPTSKLAYPAITRDKILSKKLLASLGAKVPQQRCKVQISDVGNLFFQRDDGRELDIESLTNLPMFFKPINSENGEGVMMFIIKDSKHVQISGKSGTLQDLSNRMQEIVASCGECMIEDFIIQHDDINKLYPHSVNTIRAYTILKDNNACYFGAIFRIGAHGAHNDNYASGGIIIGIDPQGYLGEKGYIRPEYGDAEIKEHPDTGVPFKGYKIPFFEEAIAQCLYIHNKMQGLYSIGWDIAITPNGPMIIELNDNWEIQPLEIVTERGWRKEYTETFVQTARKLRANID